MTAPRVDFFGDNESSILNLYLSGNPQERIVEELGKWVSFLSRERYEAGLGTRPVTQEEAMIAAEEAVGYVVNKWKRYCDSVASHQASSRGRPRALTNFAIAFVKRILQRDPRIFGYEQDGYEWTVEKIRDCLWRWDCILVSEPTLRRVLSKLQFRWNGTSYVEPCPSTPMLSRTGTGMDLMDLPIFTPMGTDTLIEEALPFILQDLKLYLIRREISACDEADFVHVNRVPPHSVPKGRDLQPSVSFK
jgi:hypothetical protein